MAGTKSNPSGLDDVGRFIVAGTSGEYVFRQGEWGGEMYIVQQGEVEILMTFRSNTVRARLVTAGDFFGEVELLEEGPRGVSARAVTDCKLLKIDAQTFKRIVNEKPEIAIRMLRLLCRRGQGSQTVLQRQGTTLGDHANHDSTPARAAECSATDENRIALQPSAAAQRSNDVVCDRVSAPDSDFATDAEAEAPPTLESVPILEPRDPWEPGEASEPSLPTVEPEPPSEPTCPSFRALLIHVPSGMEFELPDKTETVLGRADRLTGLVPDIDFESVDAQRTLSRRHAKISRSRDGFQLTALVGAGNGTFVNGSPVKAGISVTLSHGDEIRLGYVKTVFRLQ